MKKIFAIVFLSLFWCNSSFAGKTGSGGLLGLGGLMAGQWKPAISMGNNTWMVEGKDVATGIKGATEHCSDIGKNFQFLQAITADLDYPNIIFMCN